jgi:hypothetical protein
MPCHAGIMFGLYQHDGGTLCLFLALDSRNKFSRMLAPPELQIPDT